MTYVSTYYNIFGPGNEEGAAGGFWLFFCYTTFYYLQFYKRNTKRF